ncbi:MAG: hypothetical protein VR78_15865 [Hoeflea sp. BRH_c9]|nr:MAG: hypothetical protein VR78_15865 [Hoeflea sp. BRH_c9]
MEHIVHADQADLARSFKANGVAAIVMALTTAAVLLLRRPELALVFISYLGISVYALSLTRTHGVFVKPYPVQQQNFAAYVTISTLGFLATLIAAPRLIELHGSMVFFALAIVIALLLLRAIVMSVRASL